MDRWVPPPKRVTSPTWGPPPLRKQALSRRSLRTRSKEAFAGCEVYTVGSGDKNCSLSAIISVPIVPGRFLDQ